MTTPSSPNSISADDIKTEFGITGPALAMNQLYRKDSGPVYTGTYSYPGRSPYNGVTQFTPVTSDEISYDNFRGSTKYTPVSRTVTLYVGSSSWTVPNTLIGDLTIRVFGGGGQGCHWPSGAAGAAGGGGAKFIGSIPRNTVINYTVARGGTGISGDSSRYARDPGDTQFGESGNSWYMYVPGFGVGAWNMVGGNRGPGTGSTGQGAAGITFGTGGNGSPERTSNPGGNASTIGGGGGGCHWSNGGSGADSGGSGGSSGSVGVWPGGGGAGNNSGGMPSGADGAIIITGTW